ncbi:NERD domain-containing protein [Methanolobus bombayensis]|uniref:NERD domain-containing protein n=1 Tax=Methanolobus bombayensis TaxID=38023 RepID=UPI001AE9AE04|nr:archaellum component FlaC [Methanolobus bombayensis]
MVVQYGKSGAEKDLINLVQKEGFSIESLTEIDFILKNIKEQYEEKKPIIYDQIKLEIDGLKINIETAENTLELQKSQVRKDIEIETENLKKEIEELQSISFEIKHLLNYFSSKLRLRSSIKKLNHLETDVEIEINKRLEGSQSSLESLKRQLNYLENNTDNEVKSRLSDLVSQLSKLKEIKKSNEYKGALGELAVIKNLCELSDNYYLFNDLYLELSDYIRFKGSSLKSAQIDHLVVGPTGVYVIETKNWSKNYTQAVFNDGSYTPFDQIQRSGYLVYRYLNNNKYGSTLQRIYYNLAEDEVKVKSIIAVVGSKIPFGKNRYIKVLSYNAVNLYIKKGNPILTAETVDEIANKLSLKC